MAPATTRGQHDHRRRGVGQDLAQNDAAIAHAHGAAGLHELAVAQRQELGTGHTRDRRPAHDTDGDHDVGQVELRMTTMVRTKIRLGMV